MRRLLVGTAVQAVAISAVIITVGFSIFILWRGDPSESMTMEITDAKIGRLIKNLDILIAYPFAAGLAAGSAPGTAGGCGATGAPGRSFIRLSTITLSPAFKPPVTTQSLPRHSAT